MTRERAAYLCWIIGVDVWITCEHFSEARVAHYWGANPTLAMVGTRRYLQKTQQNIVTPSAVWSESNYQLWACAQWFEAECCGSKLDTSLVQIMACHLFGAKPLSEPTMTSCQLHPSHISMKFYLVFKSFHSRKCIWKFHLWNAGWETGARPLANASKNLVGRVENRPGQVEFCTGYIRHCPVRESAKQF